VIIQAVSILVFMAQEGGGPSSDDLTIGGLVATTSAIGVLLMWIRQVVKDRDAERLERQTTQAKYDLLAEKSLPVLASALPALEKVSGALSNVNEVQRSEIDDFLKALRGATRDLRGD
jgi:hypothetical protein